MTPGYEQILLTRMRAVATSYGLDPPDARLNWGLSQCHQVSDPCSAKPWWGLAEDDRYLAASFARALGSELTAAWCSVPICPPANLPPGAYEAWLQRTYTQAWSRKIDAIVQCDSDLWIVEFKVQADHYALGQLLFYSHYVGQHYAACDAHRCLLVTDHISPDCLEVFDAYDVCVIELPEGLCPDENTPDPYRR